MNYERKIELVPLWHRSNVVQRLNSGELLQQIAGQKPIEEQTTREISIPKREGPTIG